MKQLTTKLARFGGFRPGRRVLYGLLMGWLLATLMGARTTARQHPPSQVQVARRFLLAIVGHQWRAAYQYLTPTARQQQSERQFRQAAQQLANPARQYGPVIDLYKLGYRLRENATPETFVVFSFRADTLQPHPHVQLSVTFRDSAARQIQGFRLATTLPPPR